MSSIFGIDGVQLWAGLLRQRCSISGVYQRLSQEVLCKKWLLLLHCGDQHSYRQLSVEVIRSPGWALQEQETFPGIMASFNQFGFNTMGAVETELMVGRDKIKELRQRIFL